VFTFKIFSFECFLLPAVFSTLKNTGNTGYLYRADGTKQRKTYGNTITDYIDGFQYVNGKLQFVPTNEGYYDFGQNKYIYNYTDHLGNIRLSYFKGNSGGAEIIEEQNYYPFGLKHEGYAGLGNPNYQYGFQGNELQETGMYDMDARYYMPDLGRFAQHDPLGSISLDPYGYAFNNPVNFIDPTGMYGDPPGSSPDNPIDIGTINVTPPKHYPSPGTGMPYTGGGFGSGNSAYDNCSCSSIYNDPYSGGPKGYNVGVNRNSVIPAAGAITGVLAESASMSRAGAVGIIWYVLNSLFVSAHIPNHADWAYRYTGTAPLTITDVKAEYKVRERDSRTGSYTIIFGNDHKYHGKGSIERMFTSAILKMTAAQTTVKSFDWTPSVSHREAFKAEYRRMQTDKDLPDFPQGYRNPINYNLIQSPGYKYQLQDGY